MNPKYILSESQYERFPTSEVKIGTITIGANYPVVAQSMTTTDTMDTEKSVAQCLRLIESGCEIIRFTAPSVRDAENLKIIRKRLFELGHSTPLVADIHFTPNAALVAADYVEKIRINPGNFADKKKFESLEYSDEEYENELQRIKEKLIPFIEKCKEKNRAVRIGTNHGSLSDRITSHYGDSPNGMVQSAIEFIEIFREFDFHNLVISMKSSNPLVMVQAYRLLCMEMIQRDWYYPLHLGVTEAGEGEDGRIKSAIGIGALLEDGIGDTIRVSLTEEPESEIPVAKELIQRYSNLKRTFFHTNGNTEFDPFNYNRRKTSQIINMGSDHVPVVIADLKEKNKITKKILYSCGYHYSKELDKWSITETPVDYIFSNAKADFDLPYNLKIIQEHKHWNNKEGYLPLIKLGDVIPDSKQFFLEFSLDDIDQIQLLKDYPDAIVVLNSQEDFSMRDMRTIMIQLISENILNPVIIKRSYSNLDAEKMKLFASIDFGGLFIDGFGDGIWIEAENSPIHDRNRLSFGILQASRTRISKTEYISCPSCGRTLFDLQETTAKIRARTEHLKGLKIGIMGCIVNGPGEMADADYGYVGTGKGKISLYKEKEVVKRNVSENDAVDELIDLIKENGDWREP